ncbi:MAG: hypothetical protein APF80_16215 [Alphaproteobacteria bacterium BRH_c36]|nr:MAG: hypothetical protein APF80_16215 [Alphaproteobacteria bacterium BRH_c36]
MTHVRLTTEGFAVLLAVVAVGLVSTGAARAQSYSLAPTRAADHAAQLETKAADKFVKEDDVLRFINDYRENKTPAQVPGLVKAMVRLGALSDPEKAGVYTGFIAGVIGENQLKAPELIAEMFPMPPVQQVVLIKAIAFSGLPDWKELLEQFVERMPARKVLIGKYLYGDGKTLGELSMDDPFVIDAHWGNYFATGAWEPGIRIISALAWAEDQNDIEKLTIGSMAKWTLASNAARDKNLLDLAKVQMNHQDETVRRQLREVIEAAELYEIGRLREDALKRIDALRAGGPQNARDWSKWGNYGTTALALGCVVASVLGQVQFGIPCVVGGALSTAAVNYLGPERTR